MKIISNAPDMPFPGIPHAGGEFYRRHAELGGQSHDLVVVAPRNEENEAALAQDDAPPYRRLLVTPQVPRAGVRSAYYFFLLSRVVLFLGVRPFWKALVADPDELSALRQADRIKLQWFSAPARGSPRLRRGLPRTHQVGVFHDVVSQGQRRMFRTPGVAPRWRLVALVQLILAVPLRRWLLRVLDTAVVVSDKDRLLLERSGGRARIVVSPPLDDEDMPSVPEAAQSDPPEVLFVGALDRVENQDAARWLLELIWPQVLAEMPDARLTIAGAEPSRSLLPAAESVHNVQLTGCVDSLSPYYRRASVVVAPMRLGAGGKLKSVVAMLWGLPVVATSVAAEGVTGPRVFYAVEDDSTDFANAVVAVLKDPSSADGVRSRAFAWSHDTYSTARYRRSLEWLYSTGALLGGGKHAPAATEES
ncbi:glycosyltransferase [Geodermatophilus sp. SYSU D01176]